MKKFTIQGGKSLVGTIKISGSKNVATKAVIAACLTDESVTLKNVPEISDIHELLTVIESIGGNVQRREHEVTITVKEILNPTISLAEGALVRTSSMFIAPLLLRCRRAQIPNPAGCRLGARPIDRHIEGLEKMGTKIEYKSEDGYYYASTEGLTGATYRFEKNSHTGTETLILAATLAQGVTRIENAAQEHEIDDLISLLNSMGAKIRREEDRVIIIEGVEKLYGTEYEIVPDSNELVTFAVLSMLTGGNIWLENTQLGNVQIFLDQVKKIGASFEEKDGLVRFYSEVALGASSITTDVEPGFKTDWQGVWAILMTQATGESIIHEKIYENRFGYVSELKKMGAKIEFFNPEVANPESVYNFNYDWQTPYKQAIKIVGPTHLHNAILNISDLRAGATLVIAALIASGETVIFGIEHLDRGYEDFANRLQALGAQVIEGEERG